MGKYIILPVLFFSVLLHSSGPEYEGYKSLKGLKEIGLEVSIISIGAEYGSLKKDLEKQASPFLQQHGITSVSIEEARKLPGQPILRLSFTIMADMKNNTAALQCGIALTQETTMVRDGSIEAVQAKTWDNTGVTLIQPQLLIAASQDKLNDFLHQFIEDWYKSNSKPSPFKNNSKEKFI